MRSPPARRAANRWIPWTYDHHGQRYFGGPGPTSLQLEGRRIAFTWGADNFDDAITTRQLWLTSVSGRPRLIDRAGSGELSLVQLMLGDLVDKALVYGQWTINSERVQRFYRYDLTSGRFSQASCRSARLAGAVRWVRRRAGRAGRPVPAVYGGLLAARTGPPMGLGVGWRRLVTAIRGGARVP